MVEAFGEAQGIDGVDGVEEFGGAGGFVGLEMADEVDFGRGGDVGAFGFEFLDAAFAEEVDASGQGFRHGLGRMGFGNGHEADFGARACGVAAGGGDAVLDAGEVVGKGHGDMVAPTIQEVATGEGNTGSGSG